MESYCYIFVVISVLKCATCKAFTIISDDTTNDMPKNSNIIKRETPKYGHNHYKTNSVELPVYSIYLIGFTMFFMLVAIVVLSVALYLALKKKSIFGINSGNKEYVRQESTGVTALYSTNYDEQNKNNDSTLTLNSGTIEISEPRISDPVTPTRLENPKIILAKKPVQTGVQLLPRVQMDEICKAVLLRKVHKSDSASFRDLSELLNGKHEDKFEYNCEAVKESEKEKKNEENNEFKTEPKPFKYTLKPETKTENQTDIKNKLEAQEQEKQEIKNETTKVDEVNSEIKPDVTNNVKIEINNTESDKSADESDSETEYDTVPSPIRYRHSGPEPDTCELDGIPLYDLPPPRRSHEDSPRHLVQMDLESHYLMPLSTETTDSCYINAKKNPYNPS